MHATWQPGDPVIQLNFPNPLNVSVQVGDVAYFSNPNPVGQVQSWPATTTPHLSNPQSEIKMIGEIIQIIPWNSTFSAIICKMPQTLFNQYFDQIVTGECEPNADAIDILINDSQHLPIAFTDIFHPHYASNGAGCSDVPQYNDQHEVLDVAFSTTNYNNLFSMIGKFPYQCNPLQGSFGTAPQYSFSDNGITHCETGNGDCWTKLGHISIYTLGEHAGDATPPHPGGPVQFTNAFDCLDHLINHDGWNLTLSSSYTDVLNEASANNTFFYQSASFLPCYCQEIPVICSGQGSFIMFSKDNKVNMSDMLGYYASVELRNNSKTEAELFNVGTTFFESSK